MNDLLNSSFFAQLVGFVALVFYVVLFQVNNRTKMLILKVCGALLFAVHFALLGATTGLAMSVVGAARDTTYILLGKRRSIFVPATFIVLFTFAAIISWEGKVSLLALTGMIFGTLAFWQLNPSRIRLLALVASILWVTYDIISGSYPALIVETMAIVSNLVGIYRFDLPRGSKKGG